MMPRRLLPSLALLVYLALHVPGITQAPNGFHRWREADTATVAENFARQDAAIWRPRVNRFNRGTDIVGMELPAYNYAVSLLYRVFGFAHLWARLLSAAGGLVLALGVGALARAYRADASTQRLAAYVAAFSPLVVFYSMKIQPDVWAAALTVWSVVHFRVWVEANGRRRALAAALLLAVAGGIKPTYFFAGLPMLWTLVRVRGARGILSPSAWAVAVLALAPAFAWLHYARGLTETYGWDYFYLGGDMLTEMAGVFDRRFYQNLFLTWPIEMAVGVPAFLFAAWALYRERARETTRLSVVWIGGCFVVFVLAAGHCAAPHDYYYLTAVPAFALLAAAGFRAALDASRAWLRRFAVTVLVILPVASYGRIRQRLEPGIDFARVRASATSQLPPRTLAVAIDETPGTLLYDTGLKGWQVTPDASADEVRTWLAQGATVVLAEPGRTPVRDDVAALLGSVVFAVDGLVAYALKATEATSPHN
jgi:hypothetical protein